MPPNLQAPPSGGADAEAKVSNFGLSAITGAASSTLGSLSSAAVSTLHSAEDLGSSALSHAKDLGRQGQDLGRQVVTAASKLDVRKMGAAALQGINKLEKGAESGIKQGVDAAGRKTHQLADAARSQIKGTGVVARAARAARAAITGSERLTRFDIGLVGGLGDAAVGLAGSAGQIGVLSAEYQASPQARAAIDGRISTTVQSAAKSVARNAAADPSRVKTDALQFAQSGVVLAKGKVQTTAEAVGTGEGLEGVGMMAGEAASYLIPGEGEVRAGAEVGEVVTRGLAEDLTKTVAEGSARTIGEDGARTTGEAAAKLVEGAEHIPPAPHVGSADVAAYRAKLGVPDTQTVAVGKSNIAGLEGRTFEGASPKVLHEAGLPPAEPGPIKSPSTVPLFNRHAEEALGNQVSKAIDAAGLKGADLKGRTFSVHVSQEVCATCKSGLLNPDKPAGVLKQLSQRYPELRIEVTADGADRPIILQDGKRLPN